MGASVLEGLQHQVRPQSDVGVFKHINILVFFFVFFYQAWLYIYDDEKADSENIYDHYYFIINKRAYLTLKDPVERNPMIQ